VLWRLRYRLTPRDLAEMFLVRGIVFSYEAVRKWEAKLIPILSDELRHQRRRHRVEGQLVFGTTALIIDAALAGFGLAYLTEKQVEPYLKDGRLVRVLGDWCPFSGYHLYYPSRRQPAPAFALLVEKLRYRGVTRPLRKP
jgi:DNA-binding transcriptional LysR family regulator